MYSWAKIETPEPVNFKDIIFEQIVDGLKEKAVFAAKERIRNKDLKQSQRKTVERSDDVMDRTKITMSTRLPYVENKGECVAQNLVSDDEIDEDVNITIKGAWENFDFSERSVTPHHKYRLQEDLKVSTNENIEFFNRERAYELLLEFPEFEMVQFSKDRFINSSLICSSSKKQRKHEWQDLKENKISSEFNAAMDDFTCTLMNKMISHKVIEKVDGILSFDSTEALLFHAQSNPSYRGDTEGFPKEVALKIFKKTIHNYKPPPNVYYYLSTSPWKEPSIKDLPRRTINTLAKKEIINLQKVRAAGIHCPQPVMLCRHIVVMSFIGENKKPAPKLKNVILEPDEYLIAYHEVIEAMKTMYQKVNLIHTGLLENNILWFEKHCYFIDFSQAIETSHEDAYGQLINNCRAVIDFFMDKHVSTILTPNELFWTITGLDYNHKLLLRKA